VGKVFVAAAILLVVLSLVWLAVRSRRTRAEALARASGVSQSGVAVRRASGWALARRGVLATAMLAIAVVAAGFIAIPAAQAQREVIRDHVRPLELRTEQTSPLSAYRGWLSAGSYDTELFTVQAPDGVDRLRLVVMDVYDGTRFLVSQQADGSRFTRIQGTAADGGAPIVVTVGPGYTEPWVPLPGDRTSPVAFPAGGDRAVVLEDSLYYSTDDSLAIVVAPRPDGTTGFAAGDRVAVSGASEADARERIAAASGGAPLAGVDWDLFPNLQAWIEEQNAGSGGSAVIELVDRLRERGYLSHGLLQDAAETSEWYEDLRGRSGDYVFKESRAGHSAQRLEALFRQLNERADQAGAEGDAPAAYVAGVGDDEQFAAAAALIAWAKGVPARVVIGVRLTDDAQDGSPPIAPAVAACADEGSGSYSCEGRNVSAWVEIGVGGAWLPIDTSPQFTTLPADTERGASPPEFGTIPERPASSVIDPPDAIKNRVESQAAEDSADGPILSQSAMQAIRLAALVAGAIALVLVPPGILVGAKALRRSRRRAGEPEASIVGAWEELVDGCVDLRLLPRAAGGTRAQIANRIDDPVARQLAAVADRAVFGATPPTEADRTLAWRMIEEEGKRLRRDVPFWQRVRGRFSPASFLRHLRPTSARRTLEPDPGGVSE
ncbi:MAG TPA: transglutaminase domain-containing protein, partial [Microbacteriaceae bacterium]|nr:transglutaminase domain-containing protein [Microbacteriaceae bacterium]